MGSFKPILLNWLEIDDQLPKNQRRTAQRLFEGLVGEGYTGAYDSIQRYVKQWKIDNRKSPSTRQAFIPLAFPPGEVCQFDWNQETVDIGGKELKIKVAHFRLAYSRKMFQARHATSRNSGTPVTLIRSPTQRMGYALNALRP